MKVYLTDKALTKGIVVVEGTRCTHDNTAVYVRGQLPGHDRVYHFPNWYLRRREAVIQARRMRIERIASLKKQLERVKALTFEMKEEWKQDDE